jgi:thioredoxin 1
MSQNVEEVNETNFDNIALHSQIPVLVDFWAEWCGPCQTLAPIIEAVARQHAGTVRFVKLNVDDSPAIAGRYGIRGIPTLILFRDGKEKERVIGVVTEEEISRTIEQHLNAMSN